MKIKNMYNFIKIITATITIFANVFLPAAAFAAGTAVVAVSAPSSVNSSQQFTIDITVQPNNSIAGVQFNLSFDPSLVTVNSVTEGTLLKQGGASTYFSSGIINNTSGILSGVAGAIITPGQTVSTAGMFATVTLTAKTITGTCPLSLSNVVVGDINAQSVPLQTVNAQVTITAGNQLAVATNAASGITTSGATLNGNLTSKGSNPSISVSFEYGLTSSYGSAALGIPATLTDAGTFTASISGLTSNTLYHFRAKAVGDSTVYGSDQTFTTIESTGGGGGGGGSGGIGGGSTPPPGVTSVVDKVMSSGLFADDVIVSSADKMFCVTILKGTTGLRPGSLLLEQISIIPLSPQPALPSDLKGLGLVYDIGPSGTTFDYAITISFNYNGLTLPSGTSEKDIIIVSQDSSGNWNKLDSTVAVAEKTVTARIKQFNPCGLVIPSSGAPEPTTTPVITTPATSLPVSPVITQTTVPQEPGTSLSFTLPEIALLDVLPSYDNKTGKITAAKVNFWMSNLSVSAAVNPVLIVRRDGKDLEEVTGTSITESTGEGITRTWDYVPSNGWKSGNYVFYTELVGPEGVIYKSEEHSLIVKAGGSIINWSVLIIVISVSFVISLIVVAIAVFRKRNIYSGVISPPK